MDNLLTNAFQFFEGLPPPPPPPPSLLPPWPPHTAMYVCHDGYQGFSVEELYHMFSGDLGEEGTKSVTTKAANMGTLSMQLIPDWICGHAPMPCEN